VLCGLRRPSLDPRCAVGGARPALLLLALRPLTCAQRPPQLLTSSLALMEHSALRSVTS
jgi:hypothetical protein